MLKKGEKIVFIGEENGLLEYGKSYIIESHTIAFNLNKNYMVLSYFLEGDKKNYFCEDEFITFAQNRINQLQKIKELICLKKVKE